MTWWAWAVLGAVAATVIWLFVVAWLLDVVAAQRRALTQAESSIRLTRGMMVDSDVQVRALLDQNERLARHLIDRAAESTTSAVISVPAAFFQSRRES